MDGQYRIQSEEGGNVTANPDGTYTWTYEMSLFKNPTIFLLIWKIFFFIVLGIFVFTTLFSMNTHDFWWSGFLSHAKIFGFIFLGMTALVGVGYLLYAAMMGGKYIVDFTMDEKGINHSQTPAQAAKARKIGRAAAAGGMASGRMSSVGAGIAATRTEMYSEFAKTRKVVAYPRRHLIKVNGRLDHNQVYVSDGDFDFVYNYIISHCPNLKQ